MLASPLPVALERAVLLAIPWPSYLFIKMGKGGKGRGSKVMKAKAAKTKKGAGKKGEKPKPIMDWQSYIQAEDTANEDAAPEPEDKDVEEEKVPKRRSARSALVLGEDSAGQPLPVDDITNFNARQIYVAKKYAATDTEFDIELTDAKKKGKIEHRKFINNKIPKDCFMANTMTPASVTCRVDQRTTAMHNHGSSRKSFGKSLTAWEVAWGLLCATIPGTIALTNKFSEPCPRFDHPDAFAGPY